MDLAWISLAALLLVIVVSCTARVNAGLVAIALAWIVATWVAGAFGTPVSMKELIAGFPSDLFLTLTGVTLLFGQAQANGTLDRVARIAVRCCRGNAGAMPLAFFVLACVLATIGAGNIAASALLAPSAMAAAHRARVPPFLMSIMVTHGAIAGGLSPFTPTGIIANRLMRESLGLTSTDTRLFLYNFGANVLVALGGFVALGGLRLLAQASAENPVGQALLPDNTSPGKTGKSARPTSPADVDGNRMSADGIATPTDDRPIAPSADLSERDGDVGWRRSHVATLGVIAALVVGVAFFGVNVGMGAFAGAVVLTLVGAADENRALAMVPWGVILMVSGVTVLTSLLERTGGMDRFAEIVGGMASPSTAPGIVAFLTGVVSVYSSTSGVVLPAFLPMVPRLVAQMGGGDPFAIACSVIVGGHLVDSSPLSTIGALCIASSPDEAGRPKLFRQMLAWGLSMAIVGAGLCQLAF